MLKKYATGHKKRTFTWDVFIKSLRGTTAQAWYVIAVGTFVLLILFLAAITPERYNLKVGEIARTTITASKDVIDEISTTRQREEAARQVEPSYLHKESVGVEVTQNLSTLLTQLRNVQEYGQKILEQHAATNAHLQASYSFSPAEMEYARTLLSAVQLADFQLDTLLRASDQQISGLDENMTTAVENTLNTTIREGYVNESIQYLQQIIGYKTDMDLLQNVVTPVLRKVIQPNMVIDQEATAKLQEEARNAVEPVIYKQGQNIVRDRERVTANQLEMLRSLGLLDDEYVDVVMYIGGGLLVVLSVAALVLILVLFEPAIMQSPKKLSIVMLVVSLTLGFCILSEMVHVYVAPALLSAMMLTGLLGVTAGLSGGVTIAILVSAIIAGGDSTYSTEMVNMLLTTLFSGFVTIIIIRQKPYRQQVLLCGIITAMCNFCLILVMGFMTNHAIQGVFNDAIWSAGGAMIASVLCVALDPLIEAIFNLATPSKLLELSNPNHPLLRRLLLEAPGTYHHSIIVANLAEAAAEAVGANPLLARASSYFHDIGKLKRPLYFKENQMGENLHDRADPCVSAAIVTAHTRDGLIMAQQSRLPQEIQDVVIEHHGDTPVMYFYHKALQQADGHPVDIADFRYDGRRPHTKESAIVMLADTVEAAVRSMPEPTPPAIEAFIERLIRGKLEDGQLSNAPITLSDIDKICKAFSTVLNGVFHERIEYPAAPPLPVPPLNISPVEMVDPLPMIDPAEVEAASAEAAEQLAQSEEAAEQPAQEAAPEESAEENSTDSSDENSEEEITEKISEKISEMTSEETGELGDVH